MSHQCSYTLTETTLDALIDTHHQLNRTYSNRTHTCTYHVSKSKRRFYGNHAHNACTHAVWIATPRVKCTLWLQHRYYTNVKMSFSHNFKLNKNKKVGQPWWPRKNKHSIATADGSKSTIANMEQATESSSNASAQYTIKKPLVSD